MKMQPVRDTDCTVRTELSPSPGVETGSNPTSVIPRAGGWVESTSAPISNDDNSRSEEEIQGEKCKIVKFSYLQTWEKRRDCGRQGQPHLIE